MSKIWLASPTTHGDAEMKYIKEAFEENWIAPLGKNVDEFEQAVSEYTGSPYAVALSSGTAALHLALKAAEVEAGDTVICQDLTFAATCNPVLYQGAAPVFVDSERETWNMDPGLLREALKRHPEAKAVVAVNLYGTPARLPEIASICEEHAVTLVEDAAESLGSKCNNRQTGTYGRIGSYSFNGNKIITTSGGGMLVCREERIAKKARFWSTQSREKARHYEHRETGYNYRMSNILAGIGRGQMEYLKEHIARKRRIYEKYREGFAGVEGVTMNPSPEEANAWLSCLRLEAWVKREPLEIIKRLEQEEIEARPIWKPMHRQPVFAGYTTITKDGEQRNDESFPSVAGDLYERGLCLPSDIKMTDEEMDRVIRIVRGML